MHGFFPLVCTVLWRVGDEEMTAGGFSGQGGTQR